MGGRGLFASCLWSCSGAEEVDKSSVRTIGAGELDTSSAAASNTVPAGSSEKETVTIPVLSQGIPVLKPVDHYEQSSKPSVAADDMEVISFSAPPKDQGDPTWTLDKVQVWTPRKSMESALTKVRLSLDKHRSEATWQDAFGYDEAVAPASPMWQPITLEPGGVNDIDAVRAALVTPVTSIAANPLQSGEESEFIQAVLHEGEGGPARFQAYYCDCGKLLDTKARAELHTCGRPSTSDRHPRVSVNHVELIRTKSKQEEAEAARMRRTSSESRRSEHTQEMTRRLSEKRTSRDETRQRSLSQARMEEDNQQDLRKVVREMRAADAAREKTEKEQELYEAACEAVIQEELRLQKETQKQLELAEAMEYEASLYEKHHNPPKPDPPPSIFAKNTKPPDSKDGRRSQDGGSKTYVSAYAARRAKARGPNGLASPRASMDRSRSSGDGGRPSLDRSRSSLDGARPSLDRSASKARRSSETTVRGRSSTVG